MDGSVWPQVNAWVNTPIFYIGESPVTLGGMGTAVVVVVGSLLASAVLQRTLGNLLSSRFRLSDGMAYAFKRVIHYVIIVIGLLIAAQCVGLNIGSLTIMFGFLGVGVGFGLQNVTANFIAGLILLFERPIAIGDFISVGDQVGTVEHIRMRATVIRTLDHVAIIVPNSMFVDREVTNWSHGDPRIRIHCPVGVAYGSDIDAVKTALLQVAQAHPEVLQAPQPEVRFLQFGNSSLDFDLLVWIEGPKKQFVVKSQLNYEIDAAFRRANITIPFPQRDLHLRMSPAVERLAGSAP